MSNLRRTLIACPGAVLVYLSAAADALAHDPAGADVLMMSPVLDHMLHLVPWWAVLGAPPLVLGLALVCYVWVRSHVELVDEAE